MPLQVYVTSVDPEEVGDLSEESEEILSTLGDEEDAIAVQLKDLFASVTQTITESLEAESQLTIEITGSVSLKAQGGAQYLFFNVGAEAQETGTMKVVLSTTLKPKD